MLKRLWQGFSRASMAVGHFISRNVISPVLYYVLGALFTLPARVGDPLRLKHGPAWHVRPVDQPDQLDHARAMY